MGGVPGIEPVGAAAASPQVQLRARVDVGADGNGVLAARFPTTVEAPRYVVVTDRDCTPHRCAPPVDGIEVTLDEAVVAAQVSGRARVTVALDPPGSGEKELTVVVRGRPGAAVRVRVFAVRPVLMWSEGGARLLAPGPTARGLTAPLGSTKGSVRDAVMLPEVGDEAL